MKAKNTSVAAWKIRLNNFFMKIRVPAKITFLLIGLASLVWFLVRVVPKPQRATYPCVRATAPWASAFAVYLLGITASAFSFKRFGKYLKTSRYALAMVFILMGATFAFVTIPLTQSTGNAAIIKSAQFTANSPIGIAKGIKPGRVVWVYDADATNESMSNTTGDMWYENTDLSVVEGMMFSAIENIADNTDIHQAWDAIFKYFNNNHGKGDVGYTAGEKFVIKINLTTSSVDKHMNATPEMVLALLRQLVDIVGVEQSDITIGDPYRPFTSIYWNLCHTEFPDIHYIDGNGDNGREQTTISSDDVLKFSDGQFTSRLPQSYIDAAYMINMACLKTHNEGGITLCAKNQQGLYLADDQDATNQSAFNMHYPLPANSSGHKKYRHLVDYMGHEKMGGNTLLFIVDGIWAGRNWDGVIEKWDMAPFNSDYPNSLFVSQDPVAIESVGFDFLLEEYKSKSADIKYPYIDGVDDYIMQAADPANWPTGFKYDPEGDGTYLTSLGTYEHWNNATNKQYSRNLGTGNGIELIQAQSDMNYNYSGIIYTGVTENLKIFPQPATDMITVKLSEKQGKIGTLQLFDVSGKLVKNLSFATPVDQTIVELNDSWNGNYVLRIKTSDGVSYSSTIAIK
jgi:hypothetical protein